MSLTKEILTKRYKHELLNDYANYLKYEITIRANIEVLAKLYDKKQIEYYEQQLYYVENTINKMLTANHYKPQKKHLNIKSYSVVERNRDDACGLIHTHSIYAIHKDVDEKFIKNFEFDGKRYFMKAELMEKAFYELYTIECQPLNKDEDVNIYVDYMFKLYHSNIDKDGRLNDYFCFAANPMPAYIKNS